MPGSAIGNQHEKMRTGGSRKDKGKVMSDIMYRFLESIGYSHPLHAALVSIPMGLVAGAFFLSLAATRSRTSGLTGCVRSCLILALLFFIPTVLAGILDWQRFYSGVLLQPFKLKMALASLLFVLLLAAVIAGHRTAAPAKFFLLLGAVGLLTVTGLGYLGGKLVFTGRIPPAQPEYAVGRDLFGSHCSGCHPYGANIIRPEHHLWNSRELASPMTFTYWLREPEPPMPIFSSSDISSREIPELLNYLNHVLN
jgi:mono/diheme cytochrome c family protein